MPINLSKGQKVDLTKGNPGLKKIMVGLGWDVNAFDSGADFDLDASAFLVGANGKCPTEKEFIFYGNLTHPSEAVKHMGDNLTGEGEGDDEQIEVDLTKIPANVEKIAFTVTIYDAEVRRQNFGQVSNAFIRIVDEVSGKELIHYDLGEDFSIETAVVVGEMYRHNGEWKFNAIGSGFHGGLAAICGHYGAAPCASASARCSRTTARAPSRCTTASPCWTDGNGAVARRSSTTSPRLWACPAARGGNGSAPQRPQPRWRTRPHPSRCWHRAARGGWTRCPLSATATRRTGSR